MLALPLIVMRFYLVPNALEPFECYQMSDIEAGLGLKRNHLIAIALLVGNDYDLKGVQGIGLETALSFVKTFNEDEVLDRLCQLGGGNTLTNNSDETILKTRFPHCSLCGHPGSKRSHFKDPCERCSSSKHEGCLQKPIGFKCNCSSCDQDKKEKEQKKNEAWKMRVCKKIATEPNFPNNEIIQMYLNNNHTNFTADVTIVRVDDGCLMTDENMDLVMAAYPEKVDQYTQQKELKETKSRKTPKAKSAVIPKDSSSPTSRSVQLNITQFYRSSKGETSEKLKDDGSSIAKRNAGSRNFSKSARRRLLLE
ncbi:hypothetical protein L1987_25588 [Smallanthus sonchifolius]|uniref:Uncharacterized protein n=1 Tax=Smallanthus sonchifolius TaxID=185202 RepID=A0ACB9I9P1_9ASTR|nr:hypothetical protein L1987_25588 [Smallanthus sonchifolius]